MKGWSRSSSNRSIRVEQSSSSERDRPHPTPPHPVPLLLLGVQVVIGEGGRCVRSAVVQVALHHVEAVEAVEFRGWQRGWGC